MYKTLKQFQFKGHFVKLVKFNQYFQVEIGHSNELSYVYEFLTAPEAEELYKSEVKIGLEVSTK